MVYVLRGLTVYGRWSPTGSGRNRFLSLKCPVQHTVVRAGQSSGTEGIAAAVLKVSGELGVKEGEVRLFLGRTAKTAFLPCWQCTQNGPFYLIE